MSENMEIDAQESDEEVNGSNRIEQNDDLADHSVLDVQVHSTANEVSSFIMSETASTPNIDNKYFGMILLEQIKYFIAEQKDLTQPVLEGCGEFTELHAACVLNNLELVKFFVERGANINAQTRSGLTPLHVLFKQPQIDTDIVDYLINHGADLTLKDSRSETLLYIAVRMSHIPIVRIILRHPCDINALCGCGATALIMATCDEDLEMVKLLLANGADPNITDSGEIFMAIHFSIISGNVEIFKCLLDVTNCEYMRNRKLLLAEFIIHREYDDCLKALSESVYREELLLKETYDILLDMNFKICEKYKKSCLVGHMLLELVNSMDSVDGRKKMFNVMINVGLSVNSLSEECIPPLTAAAVANSNLLLDEPDYYIKKLISHGADVNYPQPESPEALLCSLTNHQVTLLLLQHSNFATPDSILNGYIQIDETSNISSEVIHLFLKLGMMPFTINKLSTLPFPSEEIPNYNTLTQNVCTLKQLCRISLRHFFCAKYKNLSIKEILNNLHLPDCINKYLRYEIL